MKAKADLKLKKWMDVILWLGETDGADSIHFIARQKDISYSYLVSVINKLETKGILKTKSTKRNRIVRFTDRGKKILEALRVIGEVADFVV